jgi:hypothetical protein
MGEGPTTSTSLMSEFLAIKPAACPLCRRILPAEAIEACPHCRSRLALGLASKDVYRLAWGILTATAFVDAGVGAFFAALLLRIPWGGLNRSLWPSFATFIAAIPLPVVALMLRRPIYRLNAVAQWILATLVVTLSIAAFAMFVLALSR